MKNIWTHIAFGAGGLVAALSVAGCAASSDVSARGVEALTAQNPASASLGHVAVACEPGQRVLAEQVVLDGTPTARFACVDDVAVATTRAAVRPAVYERAAEPLVVTTASQPVVAPRASQPVRVPVRRDEGRSWQKSAVIIGSSAGIGAGVGAAAGGKKGALIGAAIGGGGAAIWDQVTRRK